MAGAEEFWKTLRPSGLTGEQELVEFWQRMRDCRCIKPQGGPGSPQRGGRRRRYDWLLEEEEFFIFAR